MSNKLVSVIILSYKNLEYIKETIDSVLIQDYKNIQIIIGDDGTPNFNCNYYKEYIKRNNRNNIKDIMVYTNKNNLGTVKNINKAISLATGDYIKLIASDDMFYSYNSISQMASYMQHKNSLILLTNILWCNNEMEALDKSDEIINNYRKKILIYKDSDKLIRQISKSSFIHAPGVMFKKDIFKLYGNFDEKYLLMEDWPMWIRLARNKVKFEYLDIVSVKYRVGTGVSTSNEKNPLLMNDIMTCIENDILPYKKDLGYWITKNIKYGLIRNYYFSRYGILKKVLFILINTDVVIVNQIKKLNFKFKREGKNES